MEVEQRKHYIRLDRFRVDFTNSDKAYITVTAKVFAKDKGNYTADKNLLGETTYRVWKNNEQTDLSKATIKLSYNNSKITKMEYDGKELEPDVEFTIKVKENGKQVTKPLKEGEDYEVQYINNKNIGKATVIVKAKDGSQYIGSKTTTFIITAKKIK